MQYSNNFSNFGINSVNKLINYSYKNKYSGFYRKKWSSLPKIKNYDSFTKLPFLTKDELLDKELSEITMVPQDEISYYSIASGTTFKNKPLILPHDNIRNKINTDLFSEKLLKGKKPKKILILLPPRAPKFSIFLKLEVRGVNFIPGEVKNLKLMLYLIKELGIDGLMSTPTILSMLAEESKKQNEETLNNVSYLHISGEQRTNARIDYLNNVFPNAYFYFHYGCSEIGPIGLRCEYLYKKPNNFFHPNDSVLVEIVKSNGTPAKKNEIGEVVITSFSNKAFPLIRYKTGDVATISKIKCGCGKKHTIILKENKNFIRIQGIALYKDMFIKALDSKKLGKTFKIGLVEKEIQNKIKLQITILLPENKMNLVDENLIENFPKNIKISSSQTLDEFLKKDTILPLRFESISKIDKERLDYLY